MRELVAQAGRKLQEMGPQIVDDMTELLSTRVSGLDQDPQLVEMLHASIDETSGTWAGTVAPPDLLATLNDGQEWADKVTEQWITIDDLGWAKTLPRLTENDRIVHPLPHGPITMPARTKHHEHPQRNIVLQRKMEETSESSSHT